MNKRIVAAGTALCLGLGAGVAVAANDVNLSDTTTQGNTAANTQQQQQQNNVWTQQNQPAAGAAADSSAGSINLAGGGVNSGALNGNGVVGSLTVGGGSLAVAANANVALAPQNQSNAQGIIQFNANSTKKASVYNSLASLIGQAG